MDPIILKDLKHATPSFIHHAISADKKNFGGCMIVLPKTDPADVMDKMLKAASFDLENFILRHSPAEYVFRPQVRLLTGYLRELGYFTNHIKVFDTVSSSARIE